MAYLVELKTQCKMPGCRKQAVVEVFNHFNATMGKFCRPCGNSVLRGQKKREGQHL